MRTKHYDIEVYALSGKYNGTRWSWDCACGATGRVFKNLDDAARNGEQHLEQHNNKETQ